MSLYVLAGIGLFGLGFGCALAIERYPTVILYYVDNWLGLSRYSKGIIEEDIVVDMFDCP